MERRVRRKFHARCGAGEKPEVKRLKFLIPEVYLSLFGQIPDFTKKLATMRKHEISCSIILQNMAQIKTMYKDDWGSVMGNCDSLLFLGCPEVDTLEYISKLLGNEEIKTTSNSISGGKNGNQSESISKKTKPLMSIDELHRMANEKCIFVLRGEYPFFDDKCTFDETIKNYNFTADADERNTYIVKKKVKKADTLENSWSKKPIKSSILADDDIHSSSSYYTQDKMVNPNVNLSTARMMNEYENNPDNIQHNSDLFNTLYNSILKNVVSSDTMDKMLSTTNEREEQISSNQGSNDDSETLNNSFFNNM